MNMDERDPNILSPSKEFPLTKKKWQSERSGLKTESIESQKDGPTMELVTEQERVNQAVDDTMLANIKNCISSPDSEMQLEGIKTARRLMLSTTMEIFLSNSSALINMDIIPDCIKFLKSGNTNLIMETTWLLSNISAGNAYSTESLLNHGVIQQMIFLLQSSEPAIVENSVRTLGNCMAENVDIRWKLLNMRIIPPLIDIIKRFRTNMTNMKTLAYTLFIASNLPVSAKLLRKKKRNIRSIYETTNLLSIFQMEQILFGVQTLILLKDADVQLSSCQTVFMISSNRTGGVDAVLRARLLPKLIFMLTNSNEEVILSCLKSIVNIADVNTQIDQLINYGIVTSLIPFLKSSNPEVVYEAVCILRRVSEGKEDHFKEFLEFGIIEDIVSLIESEINSMDIKRECLLIMKNLAETLNPYTSNKVMEKIQSNRIMEIVVPYLKVKSVDVIDISLTVVNNILALHTRMGKIRFMQHQFEQSGGTEELENLAYHLNHSISKKSGQILDDYFPNGSGTCRSSNSSSSSNSSIDDGDSDCDSRDENETNDELEVGLYL